MKMPACSLFLPLALVLAIGPTAGARATPSTVVVELFTSQGCSSCPPADALLGQLAREPGVIALSLHVDYWDGLGWKDPFGRPEHTQRQRRYGRALEDDNQWTPPVYTPQMVVDGRTAVVGHDRTGVRAAIERANGADAVAPRFDGAAPDAVVLPAATHEGAATVWLVAWDRRHETAVERGENSGRTLVNHRVVREMTRLGRWDGARRRFAIDAASARARGRDGLTVLVQQTGQGPILGAAQAILTGP